MRGYGVYWIVQMQIWLIGCFLDECILTCILLPLVKLDIGSSTNNITCYPVPGLHIQLLATGVFINQDWKQLNSSVISTKITELLVQTDPDWKTWRLFPTYSALSELELAECGEQVTSWRIGLCFLFLCVCVWNQAWWPMTKTLMANIDTSYIMYPSCIVKINCTNTLSNHFLLKILNRLLV